jgi:hypothetical protein
MALDAGNLSLAGLGFSAIGGLTWFFSSRRRMFVRVFGPREHLREVARGILRDPYFQRGMRIIALLQIGVGALFGLAALWLWSR